MKKLFFLTLVIAIFACTAEKKGPQSVSGLVFDATMHTITLVNGSDTLCFNTTDAEKDAVEGTRIGDSAQIFYTGALTQGVIDQTCPVTKVIVTPIPIVGSWVEPIPGMEGVQGVKLEPDGVASSINMSTLVYNSWTLDNGLLYLSGQSIGNGQTVDVNDIWTVETLSYDSLILSAKDRPTLRYARMK